MLTPSCHASENGRDGVGCLVTNTAGEGVETQARVGGGGEGRGWLLVAQEPIWLRAALAAGAACPFLLRAMVTATQMSQVAYAAMATVLLLLLLLLGHLEGARSSKRLHGCCLRTGPQP